MSWSEIHVKKYLGKKMRSGEVVGSSLRLGLAGRPGAAAGGRAQYMWACKLLLHRNLPQYDFPNLSHFVFVSPRVVVVAAADVPTKPTAHLRISTR